MLGICAGYFRVTPAVSGRDADEEPAESVNVPASRASRRRTSAGRPARGLRSRRSPSHRGPRRRQRSRPATWPDARPPSPDGTHRAGRRRGPAAGRCSEPPRGPRRREHRNGPPGSPGRNPPRSRRRTRWCSRSRGRTGTAAHGRHGRSPGGQPPARFGVPEQHVGERMTELLAAEPGQRTAATSSVEGSRTGAPEFTTTTVRGLTAATRRTSSSLSWGGVHHGGAGRLTRDASAARCASGVPNPIKSAFARFRYKCAGCSQVKPMPPCICTHSCPAFTATSEQ